MREALKPTPSRLAHVPIVSKVDTALGVRSSIHQNSLFQILWRLFPEGKSSDSGQFIKAFLQTNRMCILLDTLEAAGEVEKIISILSCLPKVAHNVVEHRDSRSCPKHFKFQTKRDQKFYPLMKERKPRKLKG